VWKVPVVRGASGGRVPEVEAAALLLDVAGRVMDDGDLVCHDRRAHTSGAVRLVGQVRCEERRVADWLEIGTTRVEPGVQRIVITASSDEGTFGQVPGLLAQTISACTGEQLALYEVADATTEKAFVLGEFYRPRPRATPPSCAAEPGEPSGPRGRDASGDQEHEVRLLLRTPHEASALRAGPGWR
jgi:tellurite resistance protein TerA